ncbi:hypothetical protein SS50377_26652 [Spironucleus salmonicida]|uniref:Cilia- and flagella-associated protein 58 central coiled coil domain-containing protein n=1 Tax=Spironucleus salmonicida TaxID=348837 RepID=V6LCU2_9EUKA|nr:hypothetical protein SS50377_26652 [Spironucleus salmonicida]|eukprot:EST41496.1 hypothetical protein SS50377_19225 [Spironucleus salmonicida]
MSDGPASLLKINQLLEKYVTDSILTRSQQELFASRYQKAFDMLTQLVQNEQVHVQNIQDEQSAIQLSDDQLNAETRRQSQLSQQIFKLRSELQEQETSIFQQQDGTTKFSNEHTLLAEEKMILQQELEFIKREKQDQLRPQIALIEKEQKDLREALFNRGIVEKQMQGEFDQIRQNLETVELACKLTIEELNKAHTDLQRAQALPEKYKRQISLVKQAQSAASADCERRTGRVKLIDTEINKINDQKQGVENQIRDVKNQINHMKNDQIFNLQNEFDSLSKEIRNQKYLLKEITDLQIILSRKQNSAKMNKFMFMQQVEQLSKELKILEKKQQQKDIHLTRSLEQEKPLTEKILILTSELTTETTKNDTFMTQINYTRKEVQDLIVQYASELNLDDQFVQKLLDAHSQQKSSQQQIFSFIREIRDLQIETIAVQSQRSAASNKVARLSQSLKQTLSQLQIKDTEVDRLQVELASINAKINDFSKLYEKIKTQKNRLARLSQEAKLAISEVHEKIQVLKSETEVLTQESAGKQQLLQRQVFETRDAQRGVQTVRQELSNSKRLLREMHTVIARQISEIDALGSVIGKHEESIQGLMQAYYQAVEQRNYAGIQVIQRTDELCCLYEKLHTQEAVEKEAEAFMMAREEDCRTLQLLLNELQRDKELLNKNVQNDLPQVLQERQEIKNQLDDLRAENQQILEEIRTTAAITNNNGEVETILDLSSLYKENALLDGTLDQSVQNLQKQIGKKELPQKPPKQLKNKICATWNMVGSLDRVQPEILDSKQQNIEKRMQNVRETLLEKYVLDEELSKLVEDLERAIAQNKAAVPENALAECNEVRGRLQKTRRQLMAAISSVALEQANVFRLEQLKNELFEQVQQQDSFLKQGLAPSDEIEHEWMVQQQNNIEYARNRRFRDEQLAAQVPGLYESRAKVRFDSYMNAETGLPRPYGGNAPMAPPEQAPNVGRFYRAAKELEIEI